MLHTKNYKSQAPTFQIIDPITLTPLQTFTDPHKAAQALPGDFVEWDDVGDRCHLIRRTAHPPLAGILDLKSKTIHGLTSKHVPLYLFYPLDSSYPPFRVGCSTKDRSRNILITAAFEDWPQNQQFPRAHLVQTLGPVADLAAETAAAHAAASPHWRKYGPAVTAVTAVTAIPTITATHSPTRKTLDPSAYYTINIDPAGCKDIDDILSFRLFDPITDTWELIIGISDVDAYMASAPETIKTAAALNSQTLYTATGEAVRPMFPRQFSEDLFTLSPGTPKPTVGLRVLWNNKDATLTVREFGLYTVTNTETFSYESVVKAAHTTNPITTRLPLHILPSLTAHLGGNPHDTHEWVAELMKLYNKEAAKVLLEHGVGVLRAHSGADQSALASVSILPAVAKRLAFSAASYVSPVPDATHASIGPEPTHYCHATSPIRRYADLLNQAALKSILTGDPIPPLIAHTIDRLNRREKTMKRCAVALTTLTAILNGPTLVDAVVYQVLPEKVRMWVTQWNTLVTYRQPAGSTRTFSPGETLQLKYYADMNRPQWRERIVFQLYEPTPDHQAPQEAAREEPMFEFY
jgi:exoribonuclease R